MSRITCLGLLLTGILISPLAGILLAGDSFPTHLALFPIPTEPGTSSLSWLVWGIVTALLVATLSPLIWRFFTNSHTTRLESFHAADFPWWGWLALLWVLASWTLAWTRLSWFEPWQPHTFPLLWLGYIITANALTYRRAGHCLLLDRPRFLARLFLLSAGFWWTFEYLNQYVKNWHYVHLPETSHFDYVILTSLSFSTVLPAVLSTYEWLTTFPRLTRPFERWHPIPWIVHHTTGWISFSIGSLGLMLIGIWPTVLFPLLWLCPLLLLLGIPFLRKDTTCFHALAQGDWRPVILSALAALVCGFWWELWNGFSLVHWAYTIPSVHALKIFEMPVLGYSGYLPFGMLCLAITERGLGYPTNYP
ncbi:MAG: hypothetical protein WD425_04400 [Nitrospirales bacterium]